MLKNIVLTVNINTGCKYDFNLKSIDLYCERYNIDRYHVTVPKYNLGSPHFEKFVFVELLDNYERVLYLDSDILITPAARNIFDVYNDKSYLYAFNENLVDSIDGELTQNMCRDYCADIYKHELPDWPIGTNGKKQYFNTGVFLVSKPHKHAFIDFKNASHNRGYGVYYEQTYLNYLAVKNNIPFKSIDIQFNRLDLTPHKDQRFQADFIHYAAHGYATDFDEVVRTMRVDFHKLYGF